MSVNRDIESVADILAAARELLLILQNLDFIPEFRAQYPAVPWRSMAGMRDVMAHQYDKVSLDTVWQTTQASIPELIAALEPLLPAF